MSKISHKKAIKISREELSRLRTESDNNQRHNAVLMDTQQGEIEDPEIKIAWPELKIQREKTPDVEARLEAEHYLARAKLMQLEQEDEVKTAKKIILAAKCQAIRDAQMAERKRLLKELKEEDERMDQMMERERLKGLKVQAKEKEQVLIQRSKYVNTLIGQIEEHESKKTEDKNREFRESQKLREMHKKLDLAEEETKKEQEEAHKKVRQELNKMNEAMKHRRLIEEAEEKMANLRIQQYMRAKAVREAEREEKKRRARMIQEMEIARLRACQVRQHEVRAKEQAASIERDQEKVARAWREKELETLKKRVKLERDLREARSKQAEEKKRLKEKDLETEAKDIETFMARIEEDKLQQQDERIKHEEEMLKYRKALSKQMSEKQKRLETLREQRQKETEDSLKKQMSRKADLQEVYNMKLNELRSHRIPEKYIQGVEKQLKMK